MITVSAWHNVARDAEGRHIAILDGYQPGHPMVRVFAYQADPGGRAPEAIAEEAFAICNGHPRDAGGEELSCRYYARELRSLSAGDIVVVGEVPPGVLDDSEQARQLRTCLNDASMPLDLRVAGALVLVYGLPLSKIAYLTRHDLTRHDGQAWLCYQGHQFPLPPRLAALSSLPLAPLSPASPGRRSGCSPATALTARPATLTFAPGFAGTASPRPLHATPPSARSPPSCPPPVLASITGLHINTATRWTRSTRREWTEYLDARTRQHGEEGVSL
jgi:hypothetical protein